VLLLGEGELELAGVLFPAQAANRAMIKKPGSKIRFFTENNSLKWGY
jgi:hypothetical protein